MDCSTPGFPVHHQVPELAQTHAHWVCDAMQPSHSLLSPSPPTVNLSQLQGLSKEWALHIRWPKFGVSGSASVLPMNIQDRSSLGLTGLILQSRGISRVFSNITVQKHQFFGAQLSLWSNSYIHTWLLEKTIALTRWTFVGKVMSLLFNVLSRLVIAFLPRSKHLLISWLQSHPM